MTRTLAPRGADALQSARLVLMGTVARLHYRHGRSKVEIAAELGISRFKVARLLDEAFETGLVRLEITPAGDLDVDRSIELRERLGLRHALVLAATPGPAALTRQRLGAMAAQWLEDEVTADDVLGLPWSRSVYAMTRALTTLPPLEVVQLCGAVVQDEDAGSAVEIVVAVARLAGGRADRFYAPLIVDDADTARALRGQQELRSAFLAAERVTKAVVGLGSWTPGGSTVYDAATPAERRQAAAVGVVGEISGICFDAGGQVLRPQVSERTVTVPAPVFGRFTDVTAVVMGANKRDPIRAAIAGGLIHGLVVDADLATALLAD